jgi:hypothetical protein
MKSHEMTIDEILAAVRAQQAQRDALRDMLVTRAKLENYTETQYAALVELAREWMDVLASVQAGETITPEWIARRDDVVRRAGRFLLDAPIASSAASLYQGQG